MTNFQFSVLPKRVHDQLQFRLVDLGSMGKTHRLDGFELFQFCAGLQWTGSDMGASLQETWSITR